MRAWLPLLCYVAAHSLAWGQTATPSPQQQLSEQLRALTGKQNAQHAVGQAVVVGTLLGCTQKQVGKQAFDTFYQEMRTVANAISSYCKQGHKTEARALLLSTLETQQTNDVYRTALGCYHTQAANIAGLAGKKMADSLAQYAGWAGDVNSAKREITETDICKKATPHGL